MLVFRCSLAVCEQHDPCTDVRAVLLCLPCTLSAGFVCVRD